MLINSVISTNGIFRSLLILVLTVWTHSWVVFRGASHWAFWSGDSSKEQLHTSNILSSVFGVELWFILYSSEDCSNTKLDEMPQVILRFGDRCRNYAESPEEESVCSLIVIPNLLLSHKQKKKNHKINSTNLLIGCAPICRILLGKWWSKYFIFIMTNIGGKSQAFP